ncbi:MAG: sulfite exporter TauE/SafE family protein [Alphaproteobacteria bacterium TMED89]|nr:hypothetical protein [Rhodospirillaceae bacterium]RPH19375.1 MAG: sulfite exporter TauE/SafE family protein [Alphaproteobacteria bacterium TMED89]
MSDFVFLDQSGLFWLVAVLAVTSMGISKGGFGSGMNVASTPLLALVVGPVLAAAVMLPLLIVMDALGIRAYWRRWHLPTVRSLILPMLAGVIVGIILFAVVNPNWLRILLALVAYYVLVDRWGVLNAVGLSARRARSFTPAPGGIAAWILGTLLGITSTIAHAGGAAGTAYLLRFNFDKTTFQATTILTFTIVNLMKFPFYLAIGQFPLSTLTLSAVLLPVAAGAMLLGVFLHRIVPERPYFILMEAALFITATKLMWDGVTGLIG